MDEPLKIAELRRLVASAMSWDRIALSMGTSREVVRSAARRHGIERHTPAPPRPVHACGPEIARRCLGGCGTIFLSHQPISARRICEKCARVLAAG